ncbi:TetR/AcrR family transcriptional regulator [Glycomyces dulcitolivorans]|uniref:TetR/AcrR family transcriptional regulator n=1 Tax=Glycomyces dulcitolivorans TaxID=2200759 RepID=UPI0018E55A9F|nr:TetR/AcrR family transcriptional regulator [Glycomyces dulcitolivorans]
MTTALTILDEDGADALSLRLLAQRLGSSTATLYRHFENRADLVAQVVDRIIGEIEVDEDEAGATHWQQAVRTAAVSMFEVLSRHRNVAALLTEQIPAGPNAAVYRERVLALLLAHGFPPPLASRAYASLARYVLGFAMQLTADPAAKSRDEARMSAALHRIDAARFPATRALADLLPMPIEEEFAFGLDLLLAGLAQTRDQHAEG